MNLSTLYALVAIAPLFVHAQTPPGPKPLANITLDFYTSVPDIPDCHQEIPDHVAFTSETVPGRLTCINLENMFNHSAGASGFLRNTGKYEPDPYRGEEEKPPGIDWQVMGYSTRFDPAKNYSGISYRTHNDSARLGAEEEGLDGRWVLTVHSTPDCDMTEDEANPWFETSCQATSRHCEVVPYKIQSVSIRGYLPEEYGNCQAWAPFGDAAPGLAPKAFVAMVAAVVAGVFFL